MRIVNLALKDLKQIVRDRQSALFLVIMPVLFTWFMGLAFNVPAANTDARLPVGLIDQDSASLLSTQLQTLLKDSAAIRLEVLTPQDAAQAGEQVRDGKLAAVVTVPDGFSEQMLSGQMPKVTVIADQISSNGQAAIQAIQTSVTRLQSAAQVAHISALTLASLKPFANEADQQAALNAAVTQATGEWRQPPITIVVEPVGAAKTAASGYTQMSPGMIVQFAVFGLVTSAMILVLERKTRTLQRLLTTSMSRVEIIIGHGLAMFVIVLLQEVILIGLGQFVFHVDYLRQPLAIVLVMTALALWVAGLGLFVSTLAKVEEQVVLYSLIAMFVFTALAGAWFPLDVAGSAFSTIGHLTPGAWAMDGFQNIVVRGLGFESVLLPSIILLGYAVLFFGLGVWRFRTE